jgi:transposase
MAMPGLVIDQSGAIALLAIAVAARRRMPVAYVPGLVMRRAADLYPGEAKTDRRDALVLADTGRNRRRHIHWLDTHSDELLAQLRVLNGFDIDLAADLLRLTNRLRDALVSISPPLERVLRRPPQTGTPSCEPRQRLTIRCPPDPGQDHHRAPDATSYPFRSV